METNDRVILDRAQQVRFFFSTLFGHELLQGQRIVLVERAGDSARLVAGVDAAVEQVLGQEESRTLYVRTTPVRSVTGPAHGCAADAAALVAVILDLDVAGPGHASEHLPPDRASAWEILRSCGLEPTMVVDSGGGLHAYWVLETPLLLDTDEARERATALLKGFERRAQGWARARGWAIDSVAQLARILRVPGTSNNKAGMCRPVALVHASEARYPLAAIEECAQPEPASSDQSFLGGVHAGGGDDELVSRASALHPKLAKSLARDRPDLRDGSLSGYDMSIAVLCLLVGMNEPDIGKLIAWFRRKHAAHTTHPERAESGKYISRRIASARAFIAGTLRASEEPSPECVPACPAELLAPGVEAVVLEMRQSARKWLARLRLWIDGNDTEQEVTVSTATHGKLTAVKAVVGLVSDVRGPQAASLEREVSGSIGRLLNAETCARVSAQLRVRAECFSRLRGEDCRRLMADICTEWVLDSLKPAFLVAVDGEQRVWLEAPGRLVGSSEFTQWFDPDLLKQLEAAKDYAPATALDPSKPVHHLKYTLGVVWMALTKRLPFEAAARELGPDSRAALAMESRLKERLREPGAVSLPGENGRGADRTSIIGCIEHCLAMASDGVPWTLVGTDTGVYFKVDRSASGELVPRIAVRVESMAPRIGRRGRQDHLPQAEFAGLLTRYGLAEKSEEIPAYGRGRIERVKWIAVLRHELTDQLLGYESPHHDQRSVSAA